MMCTYITDNGQILQPTAHEFMLWNAEAACHLFLYGIVGKIAVYTRERAEGGQFQCLPNRRHIGLVVLAEMLHNEVFLSTNQCIFQTANMLVENNIAGEKTPVHKPKRTIRHRELLNHVSSDCYLYALYGVEQQGLQLTVEVVKGVGILKATTLPEMMNQTVVFHQSPIGGETEVADILENLNRLVLIVKGEAPLFEGRYLLCEGDRLLDVLLHLIEIKTSHPGALFCGKRGGNYPCAKLPHFPESSK